MRWFVEAVGNQYSAKLLAGTDLAVFAASSMASMAGDESEPLERGLVTSL